MAVDALRAAATGVPIATWAFDSEGVVRRAGGDLLDLYGTTPESVVGRNMLESSGTPSSDAFVEMVRQALAGGHVNEIVVQSVHDADLAAEQSGRVPDHKEHVLRIAMTPVVDADGHVTGGNGWVVELSAVAELIEEKDAALADVARAQRAIFTRLSAVFAAWEIETTEHVARVGLAVEGMAKAYGVEEPESWGLAAQPHDFGKQTIPKELFLKRGPLSPEERRLVETHALAGWRMLNDTPDSPILSLASEIARWHHERCDGRGYPDGLPREAIPLPARMTHIADVFDAVRFDRPYRRAMTFEEAVALLEAGKGDDFDPELLDLFLELLAADEVGQGTALNPR
jgi:HD-GYP domain-containing protein (c-di-GMP phosphodiesterase class II)